MICTFFSFILSDKIISGGIALEPTKNNIKLKEYLEPDEIPFMNYGIINRYNFSEENLRMVPMKRWDPIGLNYKLNEKFGNYSYIYGHYSYISPVRSERPFDSKSDDKNEEEEVKKEIEKEVQEENREKHGSSAHSSQKDQMEFESDHVPIDLFEPMILGKHMIFKNQIFPAYAIAISDGEKRLSNPFTEKVSVYHNLECCAISMINKFPAMVRYIEEPILPKVNEWINNVDINSKIAFGVCFLTIPTNYYTRIQDITPEELSDLFLSMISGIKYVIEESVKQYDISTITISPFFNVGKMVGGSLSRIHSQVYMDLSQDGHGTHMENILESFEKMKKADYCHICESTHGTITKHETRIIVDTEDWVVFATGSPIRNYHLRFAPKEHIDRIEKLNSKQLYSLAKIFRVLFRTLDDIGVDKNRNIIWNTLPYGYDNEFHIFGDILPHEYVGGAEMADDMRVARISPWEVAREIRSIIKQKYENLL